MNRCRISVAKGELMKKKITLIVILILLLLTTSIFGYIKYKRSYSKSLVDTSLSNDGNYILNIFMIGEADFPYGKTHCLFNLSKYSTKLSELSFDVANDGAIVNSDNFLITWHEDNVMIVVSCAEQDDVTYILYFNGNIETFGE